MKAFKPLTESRILITGGAGFVGAAIAKRLLREGVGKVVLFDVKEEVPLLLLNVVEVKINVPDDWGDGTLAEICEGGKLVKLHQCQRAGGNSFKVTDSTYGNHRAISCADSAKRADGVIYEAVTCLYQLENYKR